MSSNSILRELSRTQLKSNWANCVLVFLIQFIIVAFLNKLGNSKNLGVLASLIGLISIFVYSPLAFGVRKYYLDLARHNVKDIPSMFEYFTNWKKFLIPTGLYFWNFLWICIWGLLLTIPGIIKAISYSMSYFIMIDNLDIGIRKALKISIKMTKGHNLKIFALFLSFSGYAVLSVLTLGLGFLFVIPYFLTSFSNLYIELKKLSLESGICTAEDFA